jgi:hypothetical protein
VGEKVAAGSVAANLADVFLKAMMMTRVLTVASVLLACGILAPGMRMLVRGMPVGTAGGGTSRLSAVPDPGREDSGQAPTLAPPVPAAQERVGTRTPRELYESLVRAYEQAVQKCGNALKAAKTPEEYNQAQAKDPDEAEFTRRFVLLAQSYPQDPVAVEALNWPFTIG